MFFLQIFVIISPLLLLLVRVLDVRWKFVSILMYFCRCTERRRCLVTWWRRVVTTSKAIVRH